MHFFIAPDNAKHVPACEACGHTDAELCKECFRSANVYEAIRNELPGTPHDRLKYEVGGHRWFSSHLEDDIASCYQ